MKAIASVVCALVLVFGLTGSAAAQRSNGKPGPSKVLPHSIHVARPLAPLAWFWQSRPHVIHRRHR